MAARCGFVAIVGRPNVGKSTLLNQLLGQKISITSRKPQTTRHRILGVETRESDQFIYVDTPGWQRQPRQHMNRLMNRQVRQALTEVDCAVQVSDARGWQADDEQVREMLEEAGVPSLLALNKHDLLQAKDTLLPQIARLADRGFFRDFLPVCARRGEGLDGLRPAVAAFLPERDHVFPADQVTDRPERFLAGEIIREKSMRYLGDELPYRTTVLVDEFIDEDGLTRIHATIWVERDSQKAIVIGRGGELLKRISTDARHDLEALLERKVFLKVWVKTKRGWSDSAEALQQLGFD